jgi:F-type H+-transporting ATPase subunit a
MFVYIFLSNFLGLIPGMPASTGEMNTTLALGLAVFFYYNFVGFKEHGIAYLKHFAGPVIWLAPLMIIIELMSHLFRPISLGIRLQGNISGDHAVLEAFTNISPWGLGIPVIFYGLGVFVAFIQAFVFCLMTMTYISLSASHDH